MTDAALVRVERRGPVGVVTLDDPRRRNILTSPMVRQLGAAVDELEADPDCVRGATWLRRMQAFQAQRENAGLFSELLAVEAGRYVERIAALEQRGRTHLVC